MVSRESRERWCINHIRPLKGSLPSLLFSFFFFLLSSPFFSLSLFLSLSLSRFFSTNFRSTFNYSLTITSLFAPLPRPSLFNSPSFTTFLPHPDNISFLLAPLPAIISFTPSSSFSLLFLLKRLLSPSCFPFFAPS